MSATPGAAASVPTTSGVDTFGKVETHGIDFIPPEERHSSPKDLAWAFFGANFNFSAFILGALPVVFGLGWWSAATAILVGSLIGSAAFAGMAIYGPKTGTNSTVSSGAVFGIRGRYVGSFIAQIIDLGFFALVTWAGAEALLTTAHRLFGTGTGNGPLAVALGIAAAITLVIGILGHATVVANEKFVSISNVIVFAIVIILAASHFHLHQKGAPLALGSYWPTWLLAITVAIVNATSYGPFAGDYSRYIPEKTSSWRVFGAAFGGMFLSNLLSLLIGAFIGLAIANPTDPITGMLEFPGKVLLVPIFLLSFFANCCNGSMCVYNGSLDLHAILWRLQRFQVGIVFGVVGLAAAYLGTVVFNAVNSINALVSIVTVLVTPWMMINIIGYFEQRGSFDHDQLQAFGQRGSLYWYAGGFNLRAVLAWGVGLIVGLMFSNTSLMTGPLSSTASGVDLSFISSAVVGSLVYLLVPHSLAHLRLAAAPAESAAVEQPASDVVLP
ncbi:MAG TPA: cytosine permease [Solirubrobacteraceae bacterium]|jgi:purine-cytosine permease-like protein|nr:cytosine permease [Solirubrobacteraceae bacterium]